MRVADEMDLKNTRTITRLARAAAILGRPELADGRVGRLSMEQIDSLAGNQKMSGMDDDRCDFRGNSPEFSVIFRSILG